MSLHDLYAQCVKLGAIRSDGFQYISLASLAGTEGASSSDRNMMEKLLEQFAVARAYFNSGCRSELRALDVEVDDDFIQRMQRVHDAVQAVEDKLRALTADGDDRPDPAMVREALDYHMQELFPAYSGFRAALDKLLQRSKDQETEKETNAVKAAVSSIGQINTQINLIAVNAAIEAARVGDQGRGFAVIASEIQDLSRKSRLVAEGIDKQLL